MDLHVLPMPKTAGADALMTQAGVGLCAYKTTAQKAEAAALFVRWLTEAERNLDFVAQTGYMPVRSGAFDAILDYDNFPAPAAAYESLYAALKTMREDYTPVSERASRATTAGSASSMTACASSRRSCPSAPQPARTLTRWRRRLGRCSAPFAEKIDYIGKGGEGICPAFCSQN